MARSERAGSLFSLDRAQLVALLVVSVLFGFSIQLPRWAAGKLSVSDMLVGMMPIAFVACVLCLVVRWLLLRFLPLRAASGPSFGSNRLVGAVSFCCIWASGIICLLSVYPGYCGNDSMDVINQATGNYGYEDSFRYTGLTNHHPVLYTMLVRLVFTLAGGADATVAVFSFLLLQSGLIALLLGWAFAWLNRHGCAKPLMVLMLAVMCLLPVYAVHAVTLWKDGLFSALLLVFSLMLFDTATEGESTVGSLVWLGVMGLLVCFTRNNGVYVVAAAFVVLVLLCPDVRKRLAACLAVVLAAFLVVQGPVFALAGVEKSRFSESLGIPLQQIALVAIEDGLTDEQSRVVDKVFPVEKLEECYLDYSVNHIKFSKDFNDEALEADKVGFLLCWADVVASHPDTAFKAWVLHTRGIWQPGSYAAIGTSTAYQGGKPTDLLHAGWHPRSVFNHLEKRFPFLLGKGATIWFVAWVSLLCFLLRRDGKWQAASVFYPALFLFLTMMIATPSGWDYRYVYFFTLIAPFALFFIQDAAREEKVRTAAHGASALMRL